MRAISGIKAAWMEQDGLGELSVFGRIVKFRSSFGHVVRWDCGTPKAAEQQLKIFRAATKYPETKTA